MNNTPNPFDDFLKRAQRVRQLFTENAGEYAEGILDVAKFAVTEVPGALYEHAQAAWARIRERLRF